MVFVDYGDGEIERFVYRDGLAAVAWQHRSSSTSAVRTAYFVYATSEHVPDLMFEDGCGSSGAA